MAFEKVTPLDDNKPKKTDNKVADNKADSPTVESLQKEITSLSKRYESSSETGKANAEALVAQKEANKLLQAQNEQLSNQLSQLNPLVEKLTSEPAFAAHVNDYGSAPEGFDADDLTNPDSVSSKFMDQRTARTIKSQLSPFEERFQKVENTLKQAIDQQTASAANMEINAFKERNRLSDADYDEFVKSIEERGPVSLDELYLLQNKEKILQATRQKAIDSGNNKRSQNQSYPASFAGRPAGQQPISKDDEFFKTLKTAQGPQINFNVK